MLSRLQNKLGTAGLIVAVVALVAGLTGAAFAAGGLTKQQEKQVKKIAKKFAGKNGRNGKNGAPGAAGPAGPAGPKGDAGTAGANGTNGTNGTNGKSVVIGTATSGACPNGGSTVEVEGSGTKKSVCNGESGFTETLPSGETETGHWAWGSSPAGRNVSPYQLAPISFVIPYPDPEGPEIAYVEANQTAEHCPGTEQEPEADAGYLCVYENSNSGPGSTFNPAFTEGLGGTDAAGVTLLFEVGKQTQKEVFWDGAKEEIVAENMQVPVSEIALGTWAVTAP